MSNLEMIPIGEESNALPAEDDDDDFLFGPSSSSTTNQVSTPTNSRPADEVGRSGPEGGKDKDKEEEAEEEDMEDVYARAIKKRGRKRGRPRKHPPKEGELVEVGKSKQEEEEEEEEEESDSGSEREEETEKEREESRLKMQALLGEFDEEQLRRYESFRRSALSKSVVKRIMQSALGLQNVPQTSVIVMAGIAKVFVGEVVERALDVLQDWKETGPIRPRHLREAIRRMKNEGNFPNTQRKRPFN